VLVNALNVNEYDKDNDKAYCKVLQSF